MPASMPEKHTTAASIQATAAKGEREVDMAALSPQPARHDASGVID
ncbi:hypothetical protein [Stenotrophomonas panacihumi]|nr:hypothetical protein [Stenotrophomonas panacihumi]